MRAAPHFDIDVDAFWRDPYPYFKQMREDAPVAFVPQLGATLFTRHADIAVAEKDVALFSSHQPGGLMNELMGLNMMRKDGRDHMAERKVMLRAVSTRQVRDHWRHLFQEATDGVLSRRMDAGGADLVTDLALEISAECLKSMSGLTHVDYRDFDTWSQSMIDGISNYTGNPEVAARCVTATTAIDDAVTERLSDAPQGSLLQVMRDSGMAAESVRANIKLVISGGQNEPRDAIAGAAWALLVNPDILVRVRKFEISWDAVFEEYIRWIAPIGMSPRRVSRDDGFNGIALEENSRVFFMFSSANRDELVFEDADAFRPDRDASRHLAFGAGPHYCLGAWASRSMIADVALPALFSRLGDLSLTDAHAVEFGGWAFRGPLSAAVRWNV